MTDIQFGVMLIFNMCLGNITPPVGSVLFVGCGISKISIEQVTRTLLPIKRTGKIMALFLDRLLRFGIYKTS